MSPPEITEPMSMTVEVCVTSFGPTDGVVSGQNGAGVTRPVIRHDHEATVDEHPLGGPQMGVVLHCTIIKMELLVPILTESAAAT